MCGRVGVPCTSKIQVNFHGSIPIVGSSIGLAAGCAYHNKLNGKSEITVVYVGDASLEEGIFMKYVILPLFII